MKPEKGLIDEIEDLIKKSKNTPTDLLKTKAMIMSSVEKIVDKNLSIVYPIAANNIGNLIHTTTQIDPNSKVDKQILEELLFEIMFYAKHQDMKKETLDSINNFYQLLLSMNRV